MTLAASMLPLFAAALLAACQADPAGADVRPDPALPCPGSEAAEDWRAHATDDDRRRLRQWRDAWTGAVAQAQGAGHAAAIAAEGALLDPDAALTGPLPPAGDYACRTIKIGSPSDLLPYIAYPPFRCRIGADGGRSSFTKLTGSQRPSGRLFADSERRMVFLGTMQLGDERRAYQYGLDRERNLIAALERIGENRWRLVFPYPHFESLLDVIEIRPLDSR